LLRARLKLPDFLLEASLKVAYTRSDSMTPAEAACPRGHAPRPPEAEPEAQAEADGAETTEAFRSSADGINSVVKRRCLNNTRLIVAQELLSTLGYYPPLNGTMQVCKKCFLIKGI
jgi:hypothetical protein